MVKKLYLFGVILLAAMLFSLSFASAYSYYYPSYSYNYPSYPSYSYQPYHYESQYTRGSYYYPYPGGYKQIDYRTKVSTYQYQPYVYYPAPVYLQYPAYNYYPSYNQYSYSYNQPQYISSYHWRNPYYPY